MDLLASIITPLRDLFDAVVPYIDDVPGLRAVLAVGLMFFLPGFAWSLIFFEGKQVNALERGVLSVGLSIALVTLSMFALNLVFGVKVTGFNAVLDILIVTLIALLFYYIKRRWPVNWRWPLSLFRR